MRRFEVEQNRLSGLIIMNLPVKNFKSKQKTIQLERIFFFIQKNNFMYFHIC